MPKVVLEFYGIPRRRARQASMTAEAHTVGEALVLVQATLPALVDVLTREQRLNPHYLVAIGSGQFVTDLDHPLNEGDHVLLLSADAGG